MGGTPNVDFRLSEESRIILRELKQFCEAEIRPQALHNDENQNGTCCLWHDFPITVTIGESICFLEIFSLRSE